MNFYSNITGLNFITDCCNLNTQQQWDELMEGTKQGNYKEIVKLIKLNCPDIYNNLTLNLYNPFNHDCRKSKTKLVLVHSAIEYFFEIIN